MQGSVKKTMQSSTPDEAVLGQLPQAHSLGTMLFDPCWAERFHVDTRTELIYVRQGIIHLETRKTRVTAGPGDLLLLPAGTEHRDVFDPEQGLEVFLVQFNWAGDALLCSHVAGRCLLALPRLPRQEVAAMLDALERDFAGAAATDHLLARSRLLTILLSLLRELDHTEQPPSGKRAGRQRSREIMLEAKEYLNRHYQEPISLEDIAEALHVSPFHLSHVFSQENDFSLFAYLTNLRMTRAQQLLREGGLKIAGVAEAVGFESSSYFSKVFRKHFGYAPSECLRRESGAEILGGNKVQQ